MEKIKIIIADSHYLSRQGLAMILNENTDFSLAAEACDYSELTYHTKRHNPDLIIIDYTSTKFNIQNIEHIAIKFPNVKMLAITELPNNGTIGRSLKMGVTSHLLKECEKDEIVEAIYKTYLGERFLCSKITSSVLDADNVNTSSCEGMKISDRELEIIALIASGNSNKEVAEKLFISTHTVTTHRKNILSKLGVKNTAGLVLFAVKENLVSPNHFLFSSAQ